MWKEIRAFTSSDGIVRFPTLWLLLGMIRAFPHSNAAAERAFSLIPDVKTKKRNTLSSKTLNSLCVIRSTLKSNRLSASKMSIAKNLLEKMTSYILYAEKEKVMSHESQKLNMCAYDGGADWAVMDES